MATIVNDPTANWPISPGGGAIPGTIVGQILDPDSPEGRAALRINELGLCHDCGQRHGKGQFSESLMSHIHGFSHPVCDTCLYTKQLDHAWRSAKRLPRLLHSLAVAKFLNE